MLLADGHPKAPGLKAIPMVNNLKQPLLSSPHPNRMLQEGSVAAGQQGCSWGLNLRVVLKIVLWQQHCLITCFLWMEH